MMMTLMETLGEASSKTPSKETAHVFGWPRSADKRTGVNNRQQPRVRVRRVGRGAPVGQLAGARPPRG